MDMDGCAPAQATVGQARPRDAPEAYTNLQVREQAALDGR